MTFLDLMNYATQQGTQMTGESMAWLRENVMRVKKADLAERIGVSRATITRWENSEKVDRLASNSFRYVLHEYFHCDQPSVEAAITHVFWKMNIEPAIGSVYS